MAQNSIKSIALFLSLLLNPSLALSQVEPPDNGWPRTIQDYNRQLVVYQPQIESWKDNRIEERAAVGIEAPGAAEPAYGVIWFQARTEVDKSDRIVTLEDLKITRVEFPSLRGQSAELKSTIQTKGATLLRPISLDRLQASLAVTRAEEKQVATEEKPGHLKNEVPQISYASGPAFLLLIDGNPVLRDSGTPGILRVINTRSLLLLDQGSGKYFLSLKEHWMTAAGPSGPWTIAGSVPPPLNDVRKAALEAKSIDPIRDEALLSALDAGQTPRIFVSTGPAELIETRGRPKLEPIADTQLLAIRNTQNDLIFSTKDQSYYVLLSGRWYRSHDLQGSWEWVSAQKLPPDFAKIPETNPDGAVLASVAGTAAAEEAAISQEIPQTATINRSTSGTPTKYDGAPEFRPIEGTPLYYAANTATPVIRVDPQSYFVVQNGIWFTSNTPMGPWAVATSVPPVIYSIPPSSPVYYVTFVYVYGSTPQVVYTGYLPGYFGSYLGPDGVVVFGTGYVYPPWIGAVWIGAPCTFFGFGLAFYHPWWGPWGWAWAHGYGPGVRPGYPYRGPYGHIAAYGHVNIYRAWGHGVVRNTWNRGEEPIHVSQAARGAPPRPNNVYSDRAGNVYRQGSGGWQRYSGTGGWRGAGHAQSPLSPGHSAGLPSEVQREQTARAAGEMRARGGQGGGSSGRRRFHG